MDKTKIDWCDSTWNPVTGCLHGCEYCYARNIVKRFGADICINCGSNFTLKEPFHTDGRILPYPYGFSPTFHRYRLNEYADKKARNIFVCSMADLFGKWVPDEWIEEVFKACENAPQHNYLFLTKNPGRYVELKNSTDFFTKTKENMWFGYSYTSRGCSQWWNSDYNIFVSIEPILDPIKAPLCKWCIIGAETGRRKDKIIPKKNWIESIVNQCKEMDIPIFMKSSLSDIWGEPLIQEFPKELQRK